MSEPQLLILDGPRRRGRPRLPEPKSTVSTWVWATHHDKLIEMAKAREVSVSALVREIVGKAIRVP